MQLLDIAAVGADGEHRVRIRFGMRREADRLPDFVSRRKEMIRYPSFRERGWQIGSGPTESQCKLCTKRLKGYGRRWDRPNATAVAALDTLDRKRTMAPILANPLPGRGFEPPGNLVTPAQARVIAGAPHDGYDGLEGFKSACESSY